MITAINTSNAASPKQKSHDKLCILRESYLNVINELAPHVDKKIRYCAALAIDYHHHWQGWKVEVHRTPWVYQKLKQIHKDFLGMFSLHVVRAAHELLIALKLLERRANPGNGQDKTYQYRLRFDKVKAALEKLKISKTKPAKAKRAGSSRKFRSESLEFTVEPHTELQSISIRSNSQEESQLKESNQPEEYLADQAEETIQCDNVAIDDVWESQEECRSVAIDEEEEEQCDNVVIEDVWESQEQPDCHQEPCSAPPKVRKPKKFSTKQSKVCAAFLLDEPVFVQWWVNRLLKTKFGTEELVLTPQAFVRSSIRKNAEQALDMWESFQSEMSHRMENYNTRVEHGCQISAEEQEQIKAIAPFATPVERVAALPESRSEAPVQSVQPVAALPESQPKPPTQIEAPPEAENPDAYKLYQPPTIEVAPPPEGLIQQMMARLTGKMSMSKASKAERKPVVSELERLNADILEPALRPEVLRRVMASDSYVVDFDEQGVPYQVRRV